MSTWQSLLTLLIIAICSFLMLVILVQRGRGSGLAGAFGGAGGSSAFGAKTGDVLTWATVVIAFMFLTVTVVANFKFDESPKPLAVTLPADLAEIPLPADGGSGEVTQIKIPPVNTPTGDTTTAPAGEKAAAPAANNQGDAPAVPPVDDVKPDGGQ